jgi:hypothetical protein
VDFFCHIYLRNLHKLLIVALFLFALLAYAEGRPEGGDPNALKVLAAKLQQRLDQNPSDHETLGAIGIVYSASALTSSKAYVNQGESS